jgi:Xaa-Pro aminopeptidase
MMEKIKELFNLTQAETIILRNFSSFSDPNFYYFSSLEGNYYYNNFLILRKNKKPLLLASPLEFESLKSLTHLEVKEVSSMREFIKTLKKIIGNKSIGLNYSFYPKKSFNALKKVFKKNRVIDVSKALEKLREIKTKKEIKKIKRACKISEEAFCFLEKFFKPGMREKEIALKLEFFARENGIKELAYEPIIASGKNSAIPHHITSNKMVKKGELLLVDFGVKFQNYCADLTRTYYIGKSNEFQRKVYTVIKNAQNRAIKELCCEKKASHVFKIAESIVKKELGKGFPHALGHGIGLEVHDFPSRIAPNEKFLLKENMVVTIEPGYYSLKFGGIRIEDVVLIQESGSKRLSRASKELIEI